MIDLMKTLNRNQIETLKRRLNFIKDEKLLEEIIYKLDEWLFYEANHLIY